MQPTWQICCLKGQGVISPSENPQVMGAGCDEYMLFAVDSSIVKGSLFFLEVTSKIESQLSSVLPTFLCSGFTLPCP